MCSVHEHARVATDRAARGGERGHVSRLVIRVCAADAAELLPIQRHQHLQRIVLHQRVAYDLDVAQHMLVHRRSAGARAEAKLPARLRIPARHRQITHEQLAAENDAQSARALPDRHRHEVCRFAELGAHRGEHQVTVRDHHSRLATGRHRHSQPGPCPLLAEGKLGQRAVHEAHALGPAVRDHACVAALPARHADGE